MTLVSPDALPQEWRLVEPDAWESIQGDLMFEVYGDSYVPDQFTWWVADVHNGHTIASGTVTGFAAAIARCEAER